MGNRFVSYEQNPALLQWAADVLGFKSFGGDAGTVSYLHQTHDGAVEPLAVCVLDRWSTYTVELSIATDGSARWAQRNFLRAVYDFVFTHGKRLSITMTTAASNERALNMHEKLGHVRVGTVRDAYGPEQDGILFEFTRKDYAASKWHQNNKRQPHGKGRSTST